MFISVHNLGPTEFILVKSNVETTDIVHMCIAMRDAENVAGFCYKSRSQYLALSNKQAICLPFNNNNLTSFE